MSKNGYVSDNPVNTNLFAEFQPRRNNISSIIESSNNKYGTDRNINTKFDSYGVSRYQN